MEPLATHTKKTLFSTTVTTLYQDRICQSGSAFLSSDFEVEYDLAIFTSRYSTVRLISRYVSCGLVLLIPLFILNKVALPGNPNDEFQNMLQYAFLGPLVLVVLMIVLNLRKNKVLVWSNKDGMPLINLSGKKSEEAELDEFARRMAHKIEENHAAIHKSSSLVANTTS